jgi:hypothetical protein
MPNPLRMTCFDVERHAMWAEACTRAANLAQVREPQEPLGSKCPLGRYLEEGR